MGPAIIGVVPAALMATICESILYGYFVGLYQRSIIRLIKARRSQSVFATRINTILLSMTAIFAVLISAHLCIEISRCFMSLVGDDGNGAPNGAEFYDVTTSNPLFIVETSLYVTEAVVNDLFMIYRVYVIWGRHWVVCVPPLMTMTTLVASGGYTIYQLRMEPPGHPGFGLSGAITSFSCTLVTNVYSSGMIAWRLWREEKAVRDLGIARVGPSYARRATRTLIESAALYTFTTFVSLILFLTRSYASFLLLSITSPIIGISFCMIIIRADRVKTFTSTETDTRFSVASPPCIRHTETVVMDIVRQNEEGSSHDDKPSYTLDGPPDQTRTLRTA